MLISSILHSIMQHMAQLCLRKRGLGQVVACIRLQSDLQLTWLTYLQRLAFNQILNGVITEYSHYSPRKERLPKAEGMQALLL